MSGFCLYEKTSRHIPNLCIGSYMIVQLYWPFNRTNTSGLWKFSLLNVSVSHIPNQSCLLKDLSRLQTFQTLLFCWNFKGNITCFIMHMHNTCIERKQIFFWLFPCHKRATFVLTSFSSLPHCNKNLRR